MIRRLSRCRAAPALALLLLAGASACGRSTSRDWPRSDVPRQAVLSAVQQRASFAAPGQVPAGLDEVLLDARILLLGNRHWIQEHHCFLVELLPRLHARGVRYFLEENAQAYSWILEDYVQHRTDELPPDMARHYRLLLEGLRAFNDPLPESDRLHLVLFDANYQGAFADSLRRFQRRFGDLAVLQPILSATPGTPAYDQALAALPGALAAEAPSLRVALGAERYQQLAEMVTWEQRSVPFWRSGDDASRELVLRDALLEVLPRAGDAPIAVNTGAYHAQRLDARIAPLAVEPFGQWLAEHPESYGGDPAALRSVACSAANGELMLRDGGSERYDLREAEENDVGRILSELADGRTAMLPLGAPLFREQDLALGADGLAGAYRLGLTFDALVLYPDVTIARSELTAGTEVGTCP